MRSISLGVKSALISVSRKSLMPSHSRSPLLAGVPTRATASIFGYKRQPLSPEPEPYDPQPQVATIEKLRPSAGADIHEEGLGRKLNAFFDKSGLLCYLETNHVSVPKHATKEDTVRAVINLWRLETPPTAESPLQVECADYSPIIKKSKIADRYPGLLKSTVTYTPRDYFFAAFVDSAAMMQSYEHNVKVSPHPLSSTVVAEGKPEKIKEYFAALSKNLENIIEIERPHIQLKPNHEWLDKKMPAFDLRISQKTKCFMSETESNTIKFEGRTQHDINMGMLSKSSLLSEVSSNAHDVTVVAAPMVGPGGRKNFSFTPSNNPSNPEAVWAYEDCGRLTWHNALPRPENPDYEYRIVKNSTDIKTEISQESTPRDFHNSFFKKMISKYSENKDFDFYSVSSSGYVDFISGEKMIGNYYLAPRGREFKRLFFTLDEICNSLLNNGCLTNFVPAIEKTENASNSGSLKKSENRASFTRRLVYTANEEPSTASTGLPGLETIEVYFNEDAQNADEIRSNHYVVSMIRGGRKVASLKTIDLFSNGMTMQSSLYADIPLSEEIGADIKSAVFSGFYKQDHEIIGPNAILVKGKEYLLTNAGSFIAPAAPNDIYNLATGPKKDVDIHMKDVRGSLQSARISIETDPFNRAGCFDKVPL